MGRKTANVLQAVWFGKPTLAVDTHVYRVSHRLGLVPDDANTPRKVEDYLMQNIPLNEFLLHTIGFFCMADIYVRAYTLCVMSVLSIQFVQKI